MEKLLPDIAANSMGFAVAPERYRPYPAYRDSGVEWLGEVPAHWVVARMWQVSEAISGGTPERDEPRYWDGTIPWVSPKDMKRRLIGYTEERITERGRRGAGLKLIHPPAILVVVRGMILAHSFPVAVSTVPLTINQDMKALKLRADIEPRFFGWLLDGISRRILSTIVEKTAHGTRAIRMEHWRIVDLPLPPVCEQRAVADFLDCETENVDALVAKKERLIELLQERRTALITRAVTKGLDPDAPMKASEVTWLAHLPTHWSIQRLKRISREISVGVVVNPSSYISEEGIPFVYGSDIREGSIASEIPRKMSSEKSTLLGKSRLNAGDLVMVRVGAPGVTAVITPDLEGANCASVVIVRRENSFDSNWLCYVMNSRIVRYQVTLVQYGADQEQFNVAHAVEFMVPTPPLGEQKELSAFLDRETTKIDDLIANIRKSIDRFNELRTALISAAVTGKIDVRESPA